MKKVILFCLGLIPLGLGFLMNSWIMANPYSFPPGKISGFLFLTLWTILGFISGRFTETAKKSSNIVHCPALIMLALLLFQEIILRRYWPNIIGIASQFFYLPLLSLSYSFINWQPFTWPAFIVSFLLIEYCLQIRPIESNFRPLSA